MNKFDLTGQQESIFSIEQFYKDTPINNLAGVFIIEEPINIEILFNSINLFIKDTDTFRIRIGNNNANIPYQYIVDYEEKIFSTLNFDTVNEVNTYAKKIANQPIFSYDSDLFRFIPFILSDKTGGFIFIAHHLISDAWSIQLIIDRILNYYAFLSKKIDTIPEYNKYSYYEYIKSYNSYKNSEKCEKDKKFWDEYSLASQACIPCEYSNSTDIDYISKRKTFTLSKKDMKNISDFCRVNKISIYTFFLAIHSIYFSRINNLDNFVIGTPVFNRSSLKEKNTVGLFMDTIPFNVKTVSSYTFKKLSEEISIDMISCFRHQKYPYNNILKNIKQKNDSTCNLYNILFSYQKPRTQDKFSLIKYSATWIEPDAIFNDIQIHIHDVSDIGKLSISYDYKISKYSASYISKIFKRIKYIINQILDNSANIKLSDIEIVTDDEKDVLLNKFNNTYKKYDKNQTIHSIIEKQVEKSPNKIAIICDDNKITYKELNEKANQVANYLRNKGVKRNTFVGLLINRSIEMFIGLLGILKSGAAYLPIDPEYPPDRISYMLENSETNVVLSKKDLFSILPENIEKIDISLSNTNIIYKQSTNNLTNINSSSDLAYIIYTSGSTGKPKGVKLKHININNFILGTTDKINFSKDKTIVSVTTICFDIFVLESYLPLQKGLTIVLANEKEQNDIKLLNSLCLKYNVNMIQTTPSRLNLLTNNYEYCKYFEGLTDVLVGGEPLPSPLLKHLKDLSKNINIYNMYGPTETAVWSTIKDLTKTDLITIGSPIANTTTYVLDEKSLKLLPPETPGILFIGGDGVCEGYHKREDLNEKLFIKNPYNPKEIIYNTNDLVKQLSNGELIHLGRADFQVKIRGYRIELGEIENRILSYNSIKETVIVPYESKFLICYYSSKKDIIISDLISYLLEELPNYMIPAYFIKLDSLPLTPNGKIDRKKLPKPNINTDIVIEKASTKTEKLLESNILKLLNNGTEHIDINTPFISLGLDSLSIVQLQSMLLKYKLNLTTQTFYKYSNIKKLAEFIDKSKSVHDEVAFTLDPSLLHSSFEHATKVTDDSDLGNVFLTGANGFIGIHVLKKLLDTTSVKIYCLVRGADPDSSLKRLADSYKYYFNSSVLPYIDKRIFIINGDITVENLNLTDENYTTIKNNVSTIIHTAAIVKHYGSFDKFKDINIIGTKNITKFALKNNFRFIHLSSISISGHYLLKHDNHNIDFSENNFYIGQHYTENVYVNSKLEAENVVFSAFKNGLQGKVLRIGIISGRYSDGFFQKNINANAFYSRIRSLVNLKIITKAMLNQQIEFTPVDECAKAIVLLARTKQFDNKIFHLFNHNLIAVKDILNVLKKFDIHIEPLDDDTFKEKILEYTNSLNSGIAAIVNDIDTTNLSLKYNYTVNIKSEYTKNILKDLGFEWKKINNNYLYKIFNHMISIGFINVNNENDVINNK